MRELGKGDELIVAVPIDDHLIPLSGICRPDSGISSPHGCPPLKVQLNIGAEATLIIRWIIEHTDMTMSILARTDAILAE